MYPPERPVRNLICAKGWAPYWSSSVQAGLGRRCRGASPRRSWFAHDAERSDAVGVILAARRSSQIASALFRSKSLAIGVFKRRSLLLCDLLRTSDGLNNGSTVSCSRRRTQMEEGALNLFSIMVEFRKFIVDRNPCADVVATLKLCWVSGGAFRRPPSYSCYIC
ncbi:hypothetical protein PC114_g18762 [Phytophthora cactorum]|nr:hypothetical protein PC114_g18762 [Phytophthora cactorum]KAG3068128.1 hypothetical protein PC122_g17073 [Phytophthora cactorum]